MAKDQNIVQGGPRGRSVAAAPAVATASAPAPRRRTSPIQFLREVRAEGRKVTWTSWKETWITSVMVGIMVILTAIFFSALDGILSFIMRFILGLANAG